MGWYIIYKIHKEKWNMHGSVYSFLSLFSVFLMQFTSLTLSLVITSISNQEQMKEVMWG